MTNRLGLSWLFGAVTWLAGAAAVAADEWITVPGPATETLVGISAVPGFAVAVGDNGQIIHFGSDGSAVQVASGTSSNLFDVHVVASDFAVASGENVVLIWDGQSWEKLVENLFIETPEFYTPVWATPQRDQVLYQALATGFPPFNFLCPVIPDDPDAGGFCRGFFGKPILALCGTSGDVKGIQADGTIYRFSDGTLSNLDDPLDEPIFSQPDEDALNLIAAWIPPLDCPRGNAAPRRIHAISAEAGGNEFWQFDGESWEKQGDAGPGETLTGIAGFHRDLAFAIGRRPAAGRGAQNEGVAWRWDGENWTPDELPDDTPGLADIALNLDFSDAVFDDGFEGAAKADEIQTIINPIRRRGIDGGLYATGEGDAFSVFVSRTLPAADLAIDIILRAPLPPLSEENPIQQGDVITFRVLVENLGPDQVDLAEATLTHSDVLQYESASCDRSPSATGDIFFPLGSLPPGGGQVCLVDFEVVRSPSEGLRVDSRVQAPIQETDYSNNQMGCFVVSETGSDLGTEVICLRDGK